MPARQESWQEFPSTGDEAHEVLFLIIGQRNDHADLENTNSG